MQTGGGGGGGNTPALRKGRAVCISITAVQSQPVPKDHHTDGGGEGLIECSRGPGPRPYRAPLYSLPARWLLSLVPLV